MPLSSTRLVIVSALRPVLVGLDKVCILANYSILGCLVVLFGGDEPANGAVLIGKIVACDSSDLIRGDGRQLIQCSLVHIGRVNTLQKAEHICLARYAVT